MGVVVVVVLGVCDSEVVWRRGGGRGGEEGGGEVGGLQRPEKLGLCGGNSAIEFPCKQNKRG